MLELMLIIQMIITLFLYQKYKNKNSWIAVADALPKKDSTLLIARKSELEDVDYCLSIALEYEGGFFDGDWEVNEEGMVEDVLYYQYLPEPPK